MKKNIVKILVLLVLAFLGYIALTIFYAWYTDFIPERIERLRTESSFAVADIDSDTLTFLDWNIGYAGLGRESDFFYDGGEGVRPSLETAEHNFKGILHTISQLKDSVDFFLMQEVDVYSKRTHWINQYEQLGDVLSGYVSLFSKNYDVEYIPIPITDPMGKVESGLASFSKYRVKESLRHAFLGNYNFPYSLFFLDRCFMLKRFDARNGKDLVVINTHNSAYDDGTLKKKQMEQLRSVLLDEHAKGNYVIVGGDWNQRPTGLPNSKPTILDNYPVKGWTCSYDQDTPTHRHLNEAYSPETTYTGIIDFYVSSPNVDVIMVSTIDQQFEYSDHQPVLMRAVLK
ncbi:MAG: endonuclease/exonuclease/phosphatase family metal-dependent hydrolase [Saprospiraceae bacterium]|jgi:endonuclease/exonuclease/phosphatase family metal-dependent hydrolase